jgi:hypothetical protein
MNAIHSVLCGNDCPDEFRAPGGVRGCVDCDCDIGPIGQRCCQQNVQYVRFIYVHSETLIQSLCNLISSLDGYFTLKQKQRHVQTP